MGQEHEAEQRRAVFQPYQVNAALLAPLPREAIFLHCLPAHRGEEVTSEILDGPRSMVLPQAANRLHFQKALLIWLMLECWPEGLGHDTSPKLQSQA
jgi:ornithine carbamoyltransferase